MNVIAPRLSWRRLPWVAEILSIAVGYALYAVTRVIVLAPNRTAEAKTHATEVIHLEQVLGIYHEINANRFITGKEWLEIPASYYYASLHFILTPLILAWLWRTRKDIYAPLRSALVIATMAALVVYATWPLAPPRYATKGAVDTVLAHPVFWASGHGVSGFVNELAAMPSLHVGWAFWCAVALVTGFTSRWRYLAFLYPITTTLVVVATANHYMVDAAAGAAIIAVALSLCGVSLTGHVRGVVRAEAAQAVPEKELAA